MVGNMMGGMGGMMGGGNAEANEAMEAMDEMDEMGGFSSEAEQLIAQLLQGDTDEANNQQQALDNQLSMWMAEEEDDDDSEAADEEMGADDDEETPLTAGAFSSGWPAPFLRDVCPECSTKPDQGGGGGGDGERPSDCVSEEGVVCSSFTAGVLLSTCGHAVHVSCWQEYMSGLLRRVAEGEGFEGEGQVRPQRGEFLCSVCRGVANTIVPLAPTEPPQAQDMPAMSEVEEGGAVESGVGLLQRWAGWAGRRDALLPPSGGPYRPLVETFVALSACVQSRQPQLSLSPTDPRMRRNPALLLAHNIAVVEQLARAATPGGALPAEFMREYPAISLRLRALWRVALHYREDTSAPCRALLAILNQQPLAVIAESAMVAESKPAGQSTEGGAQQHDDARFSARAIGAMVNLDPFLCLVELLLIGGGSSQRIAAAQALALTLALALAQIILAMSAAATETPRPFVQQLHAIAAELEAMASEQQHGSSSSSGAAGDFAPCGPLGAFGPLLDRHCRPLLAGASILLRILTQNDGGDLSVSSEAPAPRDAFAAANVSPAVVGRYLQTAVPRLVSRMVESCSELWDGGIPAFAVASIGSPTVLSPPLRSLPPPAPDARLGALGPGPAALLPLPHAFEDVYHAGMNLPCELCGISPPSRALCLSCGAVVCGLETLHGPRACMTHAAGCSEGCGLFLLTSTSAVLLVRDKRLMFLGSPYRDSHGEADLGLVRGKPLVLDPLEYASLSRKWLALDFPEAARPGEGGAGGEW